MTVFERICSIIISGALLFQLLAAPSGAAGPEKAQVPSWSDEDLDTFLYGTIGTEVIPESTLGAFQAIYPDLYPKTLEDFGLLPGESGRLPIGLSRRTVKHLGDQSSIGINCASCHVGQVTPASGGPPVRVLGMTSQFDVDRFFGALIIGTFRTAQPENMKRYLSHRLRIADPEAGEEGQKLFESRWREQAEKIAAAMAADPGGAKGAGPGGLQRIKESELQLDAKRLRRKVDLAAVAVAQLKLFHNIRATLHIPDEPPKELPPAPGPGRNNAFGILAAGLLGQAPIHAPVKFGLVWNVAKRRWVHWDGNTSSPLIRNIAGALGLGAPLVEGRAELDIQAVERQTALSERILSPRYPFAIDAEAAKRGEAHYQARCASCHSGPEDDRRLHAASEIGTDEQRLKLFDPKLAERFNRFFAELKIKGYHPPKSPTIRGTQKYWAPDLRGVWARSPYLHNGSVRTLRELLSPVAWRAKRFHRGSDRFDVGALGYFDEGGYLFEVSALGNSNAGHEFGADLTEPQKAELIEYLKSL